MRHRLALEEATAATTAAVTSLVPRQVMFDSKSSVAVAPSIRDEEAEIEMRNKKKKRSKSEAVGTLTRCSGGGKESSRRRLLCSVAAFLEGCGFERTLSALRSEAQLENDSVGAAPVNLEEIFSKVVADSREVHGTAGIDNQKETDPDKVADSKKDETVHVDKKKRKHRKESDNGNTEAGEHGPGDVQKSSGSNDAEKLKSVEELHAEIKGEEKKSLSSSTEENGVKNNLEISHEIVNDDDKNNSLASGLENEKPKKKKKLKGTADVQGENTGAEDEKKKLKESIEEKVAELNSLTAGADAKQKSEKRKKKKKEEPSDALTVDESFEEKVAEPNSLTAEADAKHKSEKRKKKKDDPSDALTVDGSLKEKVAEHNSLTAEADAKHKSEKKKKTKKKKEETSDALPVDGSEHALAVPKESDSKQKDVTVENVDDVEKKIHMKREIVDSEDSTLQNENATSVDEPKPIKSEIGNDNKICETPENLDKSSADSDQTTISKKRKTEKSSKVTNGTGIESQKHEFSGEDIQKEGGQDELGNDEPMKDERNGSTTSKSKKKQKHSAEPKPITPFQRVKEDEVEFADKRLQDNSYWALDNSGSGYGAKAQEVLGQVKGRGFRHEKTKKKRGTYRGGQIDLQSHSIKFDYSDEE